MPGIKDAQRVLKDTFGHDAFKPLQEEVIRSVLSGTDTLAVMPTGGGKSLCYQIPALLFEGLTIVVSPLIALMEDQVQSLARFGVNAVFLNSTLNRKTWEINADAVRERGAKLLYIAPESLFTERVHSLLSEIDVSCITVDEAHCISDWGHDFRPEYRSLSGFKALFPKAVCLALTATATVQVRSDIAKNLKLAKPNQFVASFNRDNIFLQVRAKRSPVHQILEYLESHADEAGIIYCFSRRQVDDLCVELTSRAHKALPYHAGLSDPERSFNQNSFLQGDVNVIIATVAFGMGINKPNVRFVIHFDLPKSPEQYYQEIGRAGRDGLPASALLLYSYADTRKIRFFMEEKSDKETVKAEAHLKAMTDYASARACRRKILLAWFGETLDRENKPCCDICEKGAEPERDMTVVAQKFLSCVVRTGERYGAGYIADILMGSRAKRIVENRHHALSTWGIGKDLDKDDWFSLSIALVEAGYLYKESEYGVLSLTRDAREALASRDEILLPFEPKPVLQREAKVKRNPLAKKRSHK